ncbi:MAG: fibronectin type III domain-containing protein [Desulfobacteraceae bacterium]|jgi:fibronectin type 3 domain-containing protein
MECVAVRITFIAVFFGVLICLTCAEAARLAWDQNEDADYYRVYWSPDSEDFSEENSLELPSDILSLDLQESTNGKTYYFKVKAFNSCGNSSDFSEVVASTHVPSDQKAGLPLTKINKPDSSEEVKAKETGCFIGQSI